MTHDWRQIYTKFSPKFRCIPLSPSRKFRRDQDSMIGNPSLGFSVHVYHTIITIIMTIIISRPALVHVRFVYNILISFELSCYIAYYCYTDTPIPRPLFLLHLLFRSPLPATRTSRTMNLLSSITAA